MKKFCAKLKNNQHVKIFIDENYINNNLWFYNFPNINNPIAYNPDITVEEDEIFFVELTDEQKNEMLSDFLLMVNNSWEFNIIVKDDYENIDIIYLVTDESKIIFTKIIKSYYVRNTKILDFDTNLWPQIKEQANTVSISWFPELYFDWINKLYFKNYWRAKTIFRWLSDFYKLATAQEKNDFLSSDFFMTDKNIQTFSIWERNLRKISYLIEERNIDLSNNELRQKYLDYARQYIELDIKITTDWKLKFDNNKDVSNILNLLEEHFYTTPITCEKREINSSKKIW